MKKQDNNQELYVTETTIPGVLKIERPVFNDERGYFHEIARLDAIKSITGIEFDFVQLSHSFSKPGVIRAIHTEKLNKVVYPVTGKVFAALVDVRPESPTFGKYETFIFDNEVDGGSHTALFLPAGVGNSICAFGNEGVHYIYAVSEYYQKGSEQGIAWDDPDLNIPWPVKNPIISERDRNNPTLRDLFPDKF